MREAFDNIDSFQFCFLFHFWKLETETKIESVLCLSTYFILFNFNFLGLLFFVHLVFELHHEIVSNLISVVMMDQI